MTVAVSSVLLLLISLFSRTSQYPTTACQAKFSCMPSSACQINIDVVYPCNYGRYICCPELESPISNEKITSEYELLNSTNIVVSTNKKKDKWANLLNNPQNFEKYSEAPNFNRDNENDEFVQNAGLSGFIPSRPIFNNYPNDPKSTTSISRLAESFEDIRFNIPNYNNDFNERDSYGTKSINDSKSFNHKDDNESVIRRREPFKENCGLTFADNKVTGGKVAEIGQFPWMALLAFKHFSRTEIVHEGHKSRRMDLLESLEICSAHGRKLPITNEQLEFNLSPLLLSVKKRPNQHLIFTLWKEAAQPNTQFLCGGSLITTRHVLTAAHCIIENRPLELVFVRLGEYNLSSEVDCVSFGNRVVCAEQHVNIPVDYVTVHPEYNRKTLKNDIAVIRLRNEVRESDYIRPICLPFNKHWIYSELTGQNFTVSGWGKSESGDLFGSDILQFAKVTTWDEHKCNDSIPAQVKPLGETQLCANGPNTEDACKGDSGGPLMNITLDKSLEVRHIQFGIVSFGTATCGDKNLPTIYTRVDKYLKWILDTVT